MCGEKPTPDSAFCVRLWTPEHLNVLSELKVYMIATKLGLQETSLCDISSLSPSIRERKAPQSKGFQYFNKDTSLILVGLTFFNKFAQLHRDCTAVSLHLLEPINQCMPISQQTSASIEHFLWRTWYSVTLEVISCLPSYQYVLPSFSAAINSPFFHSNV